MSWKEILVLLLDVIRKILDNINEYYTGKKYKDAQDNLSNKDTTVDNAINDILQNTCTCFKQFSEADTTCRIHKRSFICTKLDKRSIENYKPVRIQIGDGKEAMIYPIIPDWHTVSVSTPITGKSRCYIRIPSFYYNDIDTTRDSYVRLQYNYTADKDFTISRLPKVIGSNVVLCIRYRIGNDIYRWKLWEDDLFTQNIPLYNGEVIKKNFVIEVWTLRGCSEIGIGSDLLVNTTIRRDSVSIDDIKYENRNISTVTVFENIPNKILDDTRDVLIHNWNPDDAILYEGKVERIKDSKDDNYMNISYNDLSSSCELVKGDNLLNGCSYIRNSGITSYNSSIGIINDFVNHYNTIGFICVGSENMVEGPDWVVSFHNARITYKVAEQSLTFDWRGTEGQKKMYGINSYQPLIIFTGIFQFGSTIEGPVYVAEATVKQGGNVSSVSTSVFDYLNSPVEGLFTPTIQIQNDIDNNYGLGMIGGIVAYKVNFGTFDEVLTSFSNVYFGETSLPLTFNEGIAWLDNEK